MGLPGTPRLSADADVVVIGAGPAGLTAAYEFSRRGVPSVVLEADTIVGGISRTVERDGWRFDIGGHRFFTKVDRVESLWHEILPEDFLLRPRQSRILYRGKLYDYPLRSWGALRNLGPVEATRSVLSYAWARCRPPADQSNLEGWVSARFGRRLYQHFFKTYNEKVWGVPATEIQSDWAAQRIKNLSLWGAVLDGMRRGRRSTAITSLIEEFHYPRLGPGMMWERCTELVEAAGSKVHLGEQVTRIRHAGGLVHSVETSSDGGHTEYPCNAVISSMPLPDLVRAMDPPVPARIRTAANALRHRDFLTVALVVSKDRAFPDNWIYVHSPQVRVGRIQNFGAWSPEMVKPGRTCLGMEYFVFAGDELWSYPDHELVELGIRELAELGLAEPDAVEAGYVVRMEKAYPVYHAGFQEHVDILREWLEAHARNVHPVGRNGMHRYNNQDHSMFTAMLAVENILDGTDHDTWSVNVEEEYHEEDPGGGGSVPGTGRDAPVLPAR